MSVLIKGMEMPKCCEECVAGAYEYNDNDERCFVCGFIKSQHPWECEHVEIDGIDTTKARADFCPLTEINTPHGRLIDVDAHILEIRKRYCKDCSRRKGIKNGKMKFLYAIGGVVCRACEIEDMLNEIDDAPTVIEAEEKND